MICSECRAENRDGVIFCEECGAKMKVPCPNCGEVIPAGKKFCGHCGQKLHEVHKFIIGEAPPSAGTYSIPGSVPPPHRSPPPPRALTAGETLAKVQRYLPQGLAERILSQRDRIEGERKQVTVLFTDMAGYTSMAERFDPEEAYTLMDEVYEILIRKVNEYGGTVNELTGDGIMALFGAPIAQEDAPQRAIRASLAIHREMVQFNERMRREKPDIPPLRMRAGIHTGPVVVGTVGNDLRVDFKAVGDTVNLASRMESLADPGSTFITEDTFTLTEGLFRFEGLGEREVKGKEKPIRIYRVIAPSTSRTRFDVSAERGLTPFVGRERERELLLDAFERARSGRGQAVSIVSEAGMGKSRLLYEFRKAVLNEDVTFLEGECLSFSRGIAYQPIADILQVPQRLRVHRTKGQHLPHLEGTPNDSHSPDFLHDCFGNYQGNAPLVDQFDDFGRIGCRQEKSAHELIGIEDDFDHCFLLLVAALFDSIVFEAVTASSISSSIS